MKSIRQFSILTILSLISCSLLAQDFTWSYDVAPIIYRNCTSCHHEGGIGGFDLITYEDMTIRADLIHEVIEHKSMPPWPADPNYRHFVGETVLSPLEIDLIHNWIETGLEEGNPDDLPPAPEFLPSGSLLERIDYTVAIEPYELQFNTDEYRWFVIETDFEETKYISKLEVVAGLDNVVHHADLFLDLTGNSKALDDADPLSGFNQSTGYPTNNYYINAWQPGAGPAIYPDDWGIEIPPGADLVVEIHFGPGGKGQVDNTIMNLQFIDAPTGPVRPVKAAWLLTDYAPGLVDGPLVIPANEVVTFHQESAPLQKDLSMIAICPHMHFLGKSYEVWFESPDGTATKLINIPHWDFHWQKYYTFQKVQKIPKGSVIKSIGMYDNTLDNHDNPNDPPIDVSRGLTTEDEMFLCYFIFADYEDGDEHIILDPELMTTNIEIIEVENKLEIFPNPARDILNITYEKNAEITYTIYDLKGTVLGQGEGNFSNQNMLLDISDLKQGAYFIEVKEVNQAFIFSEMFNKIE